ncbi:MULTISPECIES: cupredoxin domain-containing protein [Salinibaculum]|uniref:cupredoxin domain-containing protein n=1 Tax=Salinibaculum TaxID=2732368 RepID=UPI0030CD5769
MSDTTIDRRALMRAGVLAVAGGLAGCSGGGDGTDGDGGSGDGSEGETTSEIALQNTAFQPVRASVAPGTTVTWTNEDSFGHDVTATQFHDGAAEWSFAMSVPAGESVTHTFESAGAYEYFCTIHGEASMCGVVLVGDASLDASLPCEDGTADGGGGISY